MQIAKALAAAHQQGIVHRDLKPQNVLVDKRGQAKVLDFGLARLWDEEALESESGSAGTGGPSATETEAGLILGSPAYMSPEQARGEPVTPRSDLYSFGILLQELIEGRRVYGPSELPALIFKVQTADARPMLEGSHELIELVEALKSVEPSERPSAEAVQDRLQSILDAPRRRRRRLLAAATVLAIVLGITKYTVDLRKERRLALEAQARAETLIGFMVDDLYRGLEPLGRLDLLGSAADSATDYYEQFGHDGGDPEQWFRRARALRNSGAVLEFQGQYEKALSAYRQSASSFSGLLEAYADHDQADAWRQIQANSVARAGRALQEQGKLAESLEVRRQSLKILRQLEERADPEELEERRVQRLVEEAEIAWLLREMNRHDEALERLDAVLNEIGEPTGKLIRVRLVALHYRGTIAFERRQWDSALRDFNHSLQLEQQLYREEGLARHQVGMLMTHSRIGETLGQLGRNEQAVEAFQTARDLGLELTAKDPLNAEWKRELAVAYTNLAAAWQQQGRFAESLEQSRAALEISRELFEGDSSNASYRNDVAFDLTAIGVTHEALGDDASAHAAWQEAAELMEPLIAGVDEPSGFYLASYAEALLRLGRLEQARPALDVLYGRGWHDQELEELAVERGWSPNVRKAGPQG